MSATNHTTNYNLPVFVGTDKPAWLVDFNGAMNAIDAQMKVNADAISGKENLLTFVDTTTIDFTRTGNNVSAALSGDAAGQLSRAVLKPAVAPENNIVPVVDDNNNQINAIVGPGLSLDASQRLVAVDLDLSDTGTITPSVPSGLTIDGNTLGYAFNADASAGKLYGQLVLIGASAGQSYTINIPPSDVKAAATGSAYTIRGAGFVQHGRDPVQRISELNLSVGATGAIGFTVTPPVAGRMVIKLYPCINIFKAI